MKNEKNNFVMFSRVEYYLKYLADIISSPLATLFQMSLNEGIVPGHWLQAHITPIHKKGAKNLPENYRPV